MLPNRVVAVLTPVLFAPLAGAVSALAAKNFPGVDISASSLEEIFIAGALVATAKAAQWTHGWQKYEAREAERGRAAEALEAREAAVSAREGEFGGSREGSFADSGMSFDGEDDDLLGVDPDLDEEGVFDEPDAEPADR